MSQTVKQVNIPYRECKIMYEVDGWSIAKMADHYGIEWSDMKKALRSYGFVIRLHEPKPAVPPKTYQVNLIDQDKVVVAPEAPVTAQ